MLLAMRKYLTQVIWIGLGVITLLIRYKASPEWTEQVYSRGLYLWIRKAMGAILGWFPFPLIYLFFGILVIWLLSLARKIQWKQLLSWKGWVNLGMNIGAFAGGILFFFFFLWGFHYGRIPFVQQQSLVLRPIPVDSLFLQLEQTTQDVLILRETLIGRQEEAIDKTLVPENLETLTRSSVQRTLSKLGYPSEGIVRGRFLQPKGVFLRFSSAGLYWPFVGEGNIDSGLHSLQQPFTLAHELAHGYGITNEGVCNFIAYLACQESQNPYIQYSGMVAYWRYLAIAYQRFQKEKYWAFRDQLPKGFQADMEAINNTLTQYPDIMPRFRNFAYDRYLKSQGISEGMASYSQIIMLVKAYEEKSN